MEFFYRLHDKTLLFSSNISLTVILNSLWNSRLFVHDFFCGEKITRGGGVLDHDLEQTILLLEGPLNFMKWKTKLHFIDIDSSCLIVQHLLMHYQIICMIQFSWITNLASKIQFNMYIKANFFSSCAIQPSVCSRFGVSQQYIACIKQTESIMKIGVYMLAKNR